MTLPPEILKISEMTKSFPENSSLHRVLRRVNLSLREGEFLAITGPSGSGKTTFLHLAALLDQPTSGQVWFDDTSSMEEAELSFLRKRKIAMIFQNYYLLPYRSVLENVMFRFRYMEHDRMEVAELARQALAKIGLVGMEERTVRRLSAGEMQRVAIARAIVLPPRMLVADEPTGNLDRSSTEVIMACLGELHRSGITILLVTHNQDLLTYASRHLTCQDGTIAG
jgi:putative ABC transport system ATP-binding protein